MPDSFDQFPDAATALQDAYERDAWDIFPDAKDSFQLRKPQMPPGMYSAEGPVPSVAWGPATPGAVGGGMLGAGQRIGSLLARIPGTQSLGMPTSSEFHQARANLEAERQAAGEGLAGNLVRGTFENLLPAALASPAGVATAIASGSAITADAAYEQGKAKGLSGANLVGYVSAQAGAEALGEILPAKLGGSILTYMQKLRKSGVSPSKAFWTAARSVAGDMAGEAGTQIVQSAIDYHAGVDPHALDFDRLAMDVGQAVGQSALMGAAVTAPHVGLAALEKRLANVQAVRAKGYISAEDGQTHGIPGETRKERLANADSEIQQLEQEIQDAGTVRSNQTEVPREQEQGGEDLRGSGQVEVPAEPAGEVAPSPEILASRELLDWLAAAEAAAPEAQAEQAIEPPTVEQPIQEPAAEATPQRDVAEEIRSALASGPVTVATPKVKSGFKVAKVRDDGKVVTKKGRVLTPDETWEIKPREQPSAQPEPVREAVPPVPEAAPLPAAAPQDVPQAATGEAGQKQPWEMTRIEYRQWAAENHPNKQIRKSAKSQKSTEQGTIQAADVATVRANEVLQAHLAGKPVPPEVLADYPDLQPKPSKRSGRKDQPLADVLEPAAVAKTVARQAAERGEAYVPPFANWSKREATNKALREAGLEPVPEKLNYWRVAPTLEPPKKGKKTKLQTAADTATKEAFDELESFGKTLKGKGLAANAPLDPEVIAGAARVVAKFAKAGTLKFAAVIEHLVKSIGQAAVDRIRPALEAEWDRLHQSGSVRGMEPRVSPGTTGTKNVKTDELRQKAGMEERPPVEPETRDEWDSKAQKRVADDPLYAGKLAAELSAKPRALDPVEEMVLNRHLRDLENRRQSGEDVSDEMATAVEASERVGTIWGQTGVSRQAERAADFSLEGIVRQHVRSVNEKPSDEQMAKYAEMADRIVKLEGDLNEERQKRIQAEIDKQIAASKKVEPVKRPKKTTERRQAAEKKVADAWENFRKAMGTTAGSSGANLLGPAVEVAKAYVELGYVRFSEFIAEVRTNMKDADEKLFRKAWVQAQPKIEADKLDSAGIGALARDLTRSAVESGITDREEVIDTVHEDLTVMGFELTRSETMTAISGYGEFSELSKDEVSVKIRGIKGEIQQLLKLEDMRGGKAPKKTGIERRVPTDEERRLIKQVNEAKKRGGYTVTDPERQLKSALASAKTAARNRITDLEKAIAAREKIVSGQTALKPDAELTDLRKRRDALNEEYRKIFPPKKTGISDARRLQMAEKMLDRQLADLQADLDAGRLGPKEKKAPLTSPALEEKRKQLKSLKETREQARAASPEYQAQEAAKQNARYKKTLERSLAFWEQRRDDAAAGKLPAKRKPTPVDKAILEKKYQIEVVKREARAEIEEAERASRSKFDKALGFGGDILDLSRILMTTGEMSVVLMQGGLYTAAFPIKASRNLSKAIGAIFSRRADFAIHDNLMERPDHADMVLGGVETTVSDGPLSQREELSRSRIISWLAHTEGALWALPRWAAQGVQGFERGFRSFSNTMRADLFGYMKNIVQATRPGTWSESDMKWIGKRANSFSGRGKLPGDYSGVGLSRVFFAPRWVWSSAQVATGVPMIWKGDRAQRRAVAKVYVRGMLGMAGIMLIRHAIYYMLADDDEHEPKYELDPRSSDFAKMRLGETRLGSMSGITSLITLAARIATGETKRADGKIVPIRGDDVPRGDDDTRDIIHRFLDSKLAPLPSAVLDFMAGENVVGDKATVGKIVGERTSPMTWRDIWDAEKELNVPQGTVAALDAFFGTRVSTYGSRKKYRDASEEERKEIVKEDLKYMRWDDPDKPAYGEFLTRDQLKQFEQRRREKRGLVVYNATYTGKDEDEIKTREKSREYLAEMGVSFEEARDLLKAYYRRPDEKGRPGRITEGYFPRLRALKRMYE